jgi:hypothetical protein
MYQRYNHAYVTWSGESNSNTAPCEIQHLYRANRKSKNTSTALAPTALFVEALHRRPRPKGRRRRVRPTQVSHNNLSTPQAWIRPAGCTQLKLVHTCRPTRSLRVRGMRYGVSQITRTILAIGVFKKPLYLHAIVSGLSSSRARDRMEMKGLEWRACRNGSRTHFTRSSARA